MFYSDRSIKYLLGVFWWRQHHLGIIQNVGGFFLFRFFAINLRIKCDMKIGDGAFVGVSSSDSTVSNGSTSLLRPNVKGHGVTHSVTDSQPMSWCFLHAR